MEKKTDSITCIRNVSIKAVATESFKKLLALEVQQKMEEANRRMKDFESACNDSIQSISGRPDVVVLTSKINAQLEEERSNFDLIMEKFRRQMTDIKELVIGDLYQHGTVEGLATIRVGDNLYQKLGAMEVVIKDGIVQEIYPRGISFS